MKDSLIFVGAWLLVVALIVIGALLASTRSCTPEETRKAWHLADECVAHGGDKCWDKVQEHMGCKAL